MLYNYCNKKKKTKLYPNYTTWIFMSLEWWTLRKILELWGPKRQTNIGPRSELTETENNQSYVLVHTHLMEHVFKIPNISFYLIASMKGFLWELPCDFYQLDSQNGEVQLYLLKSSIANTVSSKFSKKFWALGVIRILTK